MEPKLHELEGLIRVEILSIDREKVGNKDLMIFLGSVFLFVCKLTFCVLLYIQTPE